MNHSAKPEPTALEKLQELLRTLFQFELSDLDFGIYRLFRLKQDELKAFIEKQLPETADKAFAEMTGSDSKQLSKDVERLAERIRSEVDPDAILDNGVVKDEVRSIKAKAIKELITEYETKKSKLDSVHVTEEQKQDVFNHLYNFFSRYYDACDFIPRRFYGARSQYAVPYSGAETNFHWANKDQHYVKTAEAFRDYAFTIEALGGPFRVRFVITSANIPKDNTKGERRYFFPLSHEITYDKESKTLRVPFHYRLPIDAELKSGSSPGGEDEQAKKVTGDKLQESLLRQVQESVLSKGKDVVLANRLAQVVNEEEVERDGAEPLTLLLKRLRHFAQRHTRDYFIHKNLKIFLSTELEFYIKDQILHLGDIEGDLEAKRRMLRVFRHLADDLVTFLSQIEDVQLHLFEKRKFVLRTDYLVTIANIPKELRKEILDPKAGARQLDEWKHLYAFNDCAELLGWKGKLTEAFLDKHPTLVISTANYDEAFKSRLLESFNNLDEVIDGLLVHAENFQALNCLKRKFSARTQCIYIDPPYNTGKDGFIYKDRYQHSSWLAMMQQRSEAARGFLSAGGVILSSIGDHELHRLLELGSVVFGEENHLATFIWNTDGNIDNQSKIKQNHEYVVAFARELASVPAPAVIDPNVGQQSKLFKEKIENTIVKNGPANPESQIVLPVGFPADFEKGVIVPGKAEYPKFGKAVKVKNWKLSQPLSIRSGWSSLELINEFIRNGMKSIRDSKGQVTTFIVKQTGAPYVIKERSAEQGHVVTVLRGMGSTQSMAGQLRNMGIKFD
jgi:adenine-specific DNA-methyltransferase